MAKVEIAFTLIILISTLPWTQSFKVKSKFISRRDSQKETLTNMQFYFHDIVSGKTPTAVRVAQGPNTEQSPTLFGAVIIADDPLTETPDPNSKLIGRAQGMYGSAGQEELGLFMVLNYAFTAGKYNGSSISILGKNSVFHPVRELSIVGGTGLFRFARGYALARTYWFNTAGDAIVGYNVTILHLDTI